MTYATSLLRSQMRTKYTTQTMRFFSSGKPNVTLENIFSGPNKSRVQQNLLTSKPVRGIPASMKQKDLENMKKAAVLIPLCKINDEPSVLFTVRSSNLNHHRGEVSFPGGMHDKADPDMIHTALRETEEELGISKDVIDIWGELTAVPGKNYERLVTPVLGYLGDVDINQIEYSRDEVETVFHRTVSSLCESAKSVKLGKFILPEYSEGQHRIWGLTGVILHETLIRLAPGLYTFRMSYDSKL